MAFPALPPGMTSSFTKLFRVGRSLGHSQMVAQPVRDGVAYVSHFSSSLSPTTLGTHSQPPVRSESDLGSFGLTCPVARRPLTRAGEDGAQILVDRPDYLHSSQRHSRLSFFFIAFHLLPPTKHDPDSPPQSDRRTLRLIGHVSFPVITW